MVDAFAQCKEYYSNPEHDESDIPKHICEGCILKDIPVKVPHEGNASGFCIRDICFVFCHSNRKMDDIPFSLSGKLIN